MSALRKDIVNCRTITLQKLNKNVDLINNVSTSKIMSMWVRLKNSKTYVIN